MLWEKVKSVFTANGKSDPPTSPQSLCEAEPKPATAPVSSADPVTKKQLFIRTLLEHPDIDTKWDKKIIYTQAYHETADFKRVIGNWNFWGITKPDKWKGAVYTVYTHEWIKCRADRQVGWLKQQYGYRFTEAYIGDQKTPAAELGHDTILPTGTKIKLGMERKFVDWATCEEAMSWYLNLIQNSPNYRDAWEHRDNYIKFFILVMDRDEPGELPYATNPTYDDTCIKLYADLPDWDKISKGMATRDGRKLSDFTV